MNDEMQSASIDSRRGFEDAVRSGFSEAAREGCRELHLAATDFANWPLGDRAVIEYLTRWAQSNRRLTVLASHFDAVVRLHPRWIEWRRQWSHLVECRALSELEAGRMPQLFMAPGRFSIRLFDPLRFRGRVSREPAELLRDREALDAVLQQSHPAFPATVTGL